ncbi:hypothetical protein B7P43_G08634 [Cryptotermes secundus]|uniref:Odorant receptor n=1 Tax=Cryptotermes secundus TaxID=105785 RepID=A0A2J7Q5Z9_9NEOP|nr:hypothetical protein B7P43_G08634 [Cryptotermes secundus]
MDSASAPYSIYSALTAINAYALSRILYGYHHTRRRRLEEYYKEFPSTEFNFGSNWLHLNSRFRKRDIYNLITLTESFTWEELPTRHPDTGYATNAGFIPKIPVIVKYTMAFIVVFQGTQSIVRMIISHDMVYSKWYPFDATVSPAYELANLSQGIASLLTASVFVGSSTVYATLVCVACSQLEKLRAALLDIRQTHITAERDCGIQADLLESQGQARASEELFRHMQKQLNNCIRHHQEIKRQEIAEMVKDAAWGCDWVGTPVPFQRCLAFIIATANKEFTLTAGKFVPVSNSTMMSIFASNFILSTFFGFQFLYATLVMVACTQLQKLRTNLLDTKQELVPSGADSGSDGGEEPVSRSEDGFCRMQMQLNECVRHHQAILQYVITFTVHVSSLQEVVKAEMVRDAAWGCDWVGTPVPFQRCLTFIIATANKEFTLTAGKFVPVSNSTMMSVRTCEYIRN